MLLAPLNNAIIISAPMQSVEIRPWSFPPRDPAVGDNANISVTGYLLPEHFNTVV